MEKKRKKDRRCDDSVSTVRIIQTQLSFIERSLIKFLEKFITYST